ncbi:hypothetical protein HPB50_004251 [Hyalomma asiaticum]|uniref:Uncharacterized protein n=1 Tax=Hyalomma asiaticum TaxID=266040 RepID=A0ACB7TCS2_HYAAI|nr:hypothetical protein HPB50_004251 [Hyalomma asiaticum]
MPDNGAACKMKRRWSSPQHSNTGPSHATNGRPFQHQQPPAAPKVPRAEGQLSESAASGRAASPGQVGPADQPSPATTGATSKTRSVATWTFQDGTEAPVSYFSAAPWKRQERAYTAKGDSHLFAPFRGRTIVDGERKSNGASLPPGPGSVFCECGVLLLHKNHEKSTIHRRRTGARGDEAPVSDTQSATEAIVRRLRTDQEFARWLLAVAAGTAGAIPAASSTPPSNHLGSPASSSPSTQTRPVTAADAAPASSPSDILGSPASTSPGLPTWSATPFNNSTTTAAVRGDSSLIDMDFGAFLEG